MVPWYEDEKLLSPVNGYDYLCNHEFNQFKQIDNKIEKILDTPLGYIVIRNLNDK